MTSDISIIINFRPFQMMSRQELIIFQFNQQMLPSHEIREQEEEYINNIRCKKCQIGV